MTIGETTLPILNENVTFNTSIILLKSITTLKQIKIFTQLSTICRQRKQFNCIVSDTYFLSVRPGGQ